MAKPTINDVARLADVSKKTVSRVINDSPLLNEATRAKVQQVIADLGYVPDPQARALALRRNVVADEGDLPIPVAPIPETSDPEASVPPPPRFPVTSPADPAPLLPRLPIVPPPDPVPQPAATPQPAPTPAPRFVPAAPPEVPLPPPPAPAAAASPITLRDDRRLIALVYDDSAAQLLPEMQQGIFAAIRDTEFALLLRPLDGYDRDTEFRRFITQQRPAGILLLPPLSEGETLAGICRELGCNHIRISARPHDDTAHAVTSDDRGAAARAVAYLISLGHRRIGMVTGPDESRTAQERELGYLDAMADHDLDRGPALIETGDDSFSSGYSAGQLLLEVSPRPTAIFAGNDDMAAGIVHAAVQKGIAVPEALSVVGFEDAPIAARLCPQLTTVRVPIAEMALAAALKLIDWEAGAAQPSRFAPELVVRASVAPPPA